MDQDKIKEMIIAAIQQVAPEIEEGDIDPDEELREECDLDSMDFLNVLEAIKKACGVNIPELDYVEVSTFNKMAAYLAGKITV